MHLCLNATLESLNLRLKELLGPVTGIEKKKKDMNVNPWGRHHSW